MNPIDRKIYEYEVLLNNAKEELKKDYCTKSLELYIKGKIDAYEMILTDLKQLKNE